MVATLLLASATRGISCAVAALSAITLIRFGINLGGDSVRLNQPQFCRYYLAVSLSYAKRASSFINLQAMGLCNVFAHFAEGVPSSQ